MIRLLRNKVRDCCWHAVSGRGAFGYGFGDGDWPILPTNFEPDVINVSTDARGCDQHMDTKHSRLVPKSGGDGFELISCHANRDEHVMLITDSFDIEKPTAEVIESGEVDVFYYPTAKITERSGWVHIRGHIAIRFNEPDSYVLIKILSNGRTLPFGYAYSWKYGHLHIGGADRLEEFEADPVAYFEKKVPEANKFDAICARYGERRKLARRFKRIVAGYRFASMPTDGIFAFGADAVTVSFGGKVFLFYYHEDAVEPFRQCVKTIDDIFSKCVAPVLLNGGALCRDIVSNQSYCRFSE